VILVLLLVVGPLVVFARPLRLARRRGIFEYGALATGVGQQFESKWLLRSHVDEGALEVPDFSATTDLYQTVSNVREMRSLPVDLKSVRALVVAALAPFVPIAMMVLPVKTVLKDVVKLLL
jgi:hypothetical protein